MPSSILFLQHGMASGNQEMIALSQRVASSSVYISAPDLNYLRTFFSINPLIDIVEENASKVIGKFPYLPIRIVAFSLGGILWIEVLSRHPEWWKKIKALVFIGSPIGGASLAKAIDPFEWGIGIAQELGRSRRYLAEKIASEIPTLVIAGSLSRGGDGIVPLESTKLRSANFARIPGVSHQELIKNISVDREIRRFCRNPNFPQVSLCNRRLENLIEHFNNVPGITPADEGDYSSSTIIYQFSDGMTLRTWKNLVGVDHVFIGDKNAQCVYSGFVGWIHSAALERAIEAAKKF